MVLKDIESIEQAIKDGKKVLIDFWAPWCGPCRIMSPVIDQLASEAEDLIVGKVDIEEYPLAAEKYQVTSIPTLVLFENGEPTKAESGAKNLATLKTFVGI